MDYAKESLKLHEQWKGKIEVVATVPVSTKDDLSLAYTPGVAQPCLEIQKDINKSYELTRRHNLCAVITDGTAVLGLGDIGPEAGMPVMEGKCVLFISRNSGTPRASLGGAGRLVSAQISPAAFLGALANSSPWTMYLDTDL